MKNRSMPNGKENIKKLLEYQQDSIVSKVLLKNKSGNVTFFAFDELQELSEHTAPHDALIFIIDGKAQISIEGIQHELEAGEMIMLPANIPHAVKAIEQFKMCLTMLRN